MSCYIRQADFKVMFIQLNEATNHTVHISNHRARSTLSEALKGGLYIISMNLSFV